jgi:cellulose synthase/poly-beta-1,6-N-acetylglucosamine synthase-like glycosyltransferase
MQQTLRYYSLNNFTFFVTMWFALIGLAICLTLIYCVLILFYYAWFNRLRYFKPDETLKPVTGFSIIIPARNEQENIERCVSSILNNDYPEKLYEVIVVDDFSEDATSSVVKKTQEQFSNLKLIELKNFVDTKLNSYKKKSIETAIANSSYEWVVTTDADCEVSKQWLPLFDSFIQTNDPVFIAAPVKFFNNNSFISIFQCLDFISLQGITAASVSAGFHSMCNGANLAYKKEAFNAVNGFKGVDNIASGDDMLLMHKIQQRFPNKSGYLFNKKIIVSTPPMPDIKSFINQRIRWASKATNYSDKKIFLVLLLVYIFNLCLFVLPFIAIFKHKLFLYWLALLFLKTCCELVFMFPVAKFFGQQKLLWWFPVMQPFHIVYTVISGWLGKFGTYQWKGRIVN